MTVLKIFLFIFLNLIVTFAKISDKRLCYNEDCSEPVSEAKTLMRYGGDDSRILSFAANQNVKIFSKSAGSRIDLWGAEINGKRGYVPISLVKEFKIIHKKLNHLVDTEGVDETIPADKTKEKIITEVPKPVEKEILPNTVTPPYEIIDGTTIYTSEPPDFSSTPSNADNLVTQSEKHISEHVTEPTLPVEPNTETVINNLAPNAENSERKTNEPVESDTKTIIANITEKQISEHVTEKNLQVESENVTQNGADDSKKQISENETNTTLPVEKTIIANVTENSSEKPISEQVTEKNHQVESETKENVTQNSDDHSKKQISENETNTTFPVEDGTNLNVEQKETEKKNDDIIYDLSEEKNSDQNLPSNINVENKEIPKQEGKIIEENVISKSENKSAEIIDVNDDDEEEEESDDGDDDEEEEEEEEFSENPEKPVNNDFSNAQITKSTESTQTSSEINSIETLNEIIKDSSVSVEDISTITHREQPNNTITNSDMNLENNSANAEESANKNSEQKKIEPGVPSLFQNPLNFFSSQEVKVETNTQVPTSEYESNAAASETSESSELNVKLSATTETPIVQDEHPFDTLQESFTENSNVVLNDKTPEFIDIQQSGSVKQSELLTDINSDLILENQDIEFDKNSIEYIQNNVGGSGAVEQISSNSMIDQTTENNQNIDYLQNSSENTSDEPGFFSNIFSTIFGSKQDDSNHENTFDNNPEEMKNPWTAHVEENPSEKYLMTEQSDMQSCNAGKDSSCPLAQNPNYIRSENGDISWSYEIPENAYTILLYLTLTSITVLIFSLGYYYIEKRRKDGKLIANINELEKKLLITTKECHLAQNELKITKEKLESVEDTTCGSDVALENLKEELETVKCSKVELEEHIANLENELEKATETGMEMSEMLNELLTSQSGNEHLMKTINGLQKQLNDQKVTLNHTQLRLAEKSTENELLRTELQVTNEKVSHLQAELDKMVVNILLVQEEKSKIESESEAQIEKLTRDHDSVSTRLNKELASLQEQIQKYNSLIEDTKRQLDIKSNEYDLLKQSMKDIEGVQSNKESMKALLDVSHVKAEVLQLREEKHKLSDKLQKEIEVKLLNEKEVQVMLQEVKILKDKFEEAEKEKVEAETRLEVLSSYFKEREAQYQKEINENESKWIQKEGEATGTIERIKWIQEELQNYKSQNELLKKEILDQEVSLKSQISMLEKKNHENWLLTRQAERKLEDSKQEASQLRNRLTIVEKNLNNTSQMNDENMIQNHSNGDVAVSPLHMTNPENPGSPPLLFPHRDHMTTSPALQVLPPFMPPPHHGVHFMPPPPLTGVPPFMPPPPPLFPGDHRPPPLGRMSSPPLHGRYSPDSRTYSPYDRDESPPLSPTYTDDYRRRTPPPNVNHLPPRNYSPYSSGKQRYWDDKMEYRGPHHRNKSRPHKGLSSGSGNSDESLENSGRHSGRV